MFENDGCTLFPDGWWGVSWRACCDVHDTAFNTGRTLEQYFLANIQLFDCVAAINLVAAIIMMVGVSSPVALALFVFGRKNSSE